MQIIVFENGKGECGTRIFSRSGEQSSFHQLNDFVLWILHLLAITELDERSMYSIGVDDVHFDWGGAIGPGTREAIVAELDEGGAVA